MVLPTHAPKPPKNMHVRELIIYGSTNMRECELGTYKEVHVGMLEESWI